MTGSAQAAEMAATANAPAAVSALPAGTVAIVNGVAIPQARLDEAVPATVQGAGHPDSPQLRQMLKQQLIVRELFRQNAEAAHYDTKPEVQQAINAAKTNAETQLYLRDSIHPEPVTDAQVKARYDEIVASLGKDEYKPGIITVADDATASKVIAQLKSGTAFGTLARQYSSAPTGPAGGELPWVSFRTPAAEGKTAGLPLAVAQALTRLPVGAVTPAPVTVDNLRVIVKLDAKRPTQVPAFDEAKDTIRQQLQAIALEKAAAQFSGQLLKGASIQQ
ncbi:peptidyl-prolyl cis-trans isomerase [Paraburkholderia rhynchosiae]|nr:peptidyl-prolyl cis-trans isomerase [Paraburkholderia rhynchosiae]